MNKVGVIAFCGSKGSGKSTSASIFKDVIGVPTEEIAIAGHLKEVCSRVFKVDYETFINPALKELELENFVLLDRSNLELLMRGFLVERYDVDSHIRPHVGRVLRTPRALLQYIGTEVLHPLDPLIHVKVAMKKKDSAKLTVITDLRFVNEFEYFNAEHSDEFLPVYVKNSTAEIKASVDAHPSERQFENFKNKCLLLDNEGSLEQLKSGIKKLILEEYE